MVNVSQDPLLLVASTNPVPDLAQLDTNEVAAALAAIEQRWAIETGAVRPEPVRRGRLQPVLVALVAVALVIAAIAIPLWLIRYSSTPDPVIDEPTSTIVPTTEAPTPTTLPPVPVTTTTPVPTTVPPAIPLQWQILPIDPSVEGGIFLGVTVGGPGLVAGGIIDGDVFEAAVWVSSDGLSWSRAGDPAVFAPITPDGDTRVLDVAAGPDAIVAVGLDGFDAAVWRSVDGLTWERITSESLGGDDVQQMDVVVADESGFVAVGRDGVDGAVWVSTDGTAWERVPEAAVMEGPGTVITYRASGLGIVEPGGWDALAIWLAADRLSWVDPVGPVDPETGVGPYGIVGWGEGFLAYGPSGAWTSVDGLNWDSIEAPALASDFGSPHQPMAAVTRNGTVIVVGATVSGDGAVWTSVDNGTTWERSTLPPSEIETGWLVDIVQYDSQLIAVGDAVLVGTWND